MSSGKAVISLGCAGMRTFTDMADDKLLVTIPGALLAALTGSLAATGAANTEMRAFYASRKG